MDWKKTLATVAPGIATALGGPLAGVAVKMAADALGVEASEDAVAAVVAGGDPQALAALKRADHDFKVAMRKLDIEDKALDVQNTRSARELAIAKGLVIQAVLSGVFVIGYFGIFAVLLQQFFAVEPIPLSKEALSIISILLGVMTGAVKDIMQFWFGSSAGSKMKTAQEGLRQ